MYYIQCSSALRCFHPIVLGLKNPLALMSYVTPVMTVVTLLLSVILDPWDEFRKNNYFNSIHHVTQSIMLMLFGGTLAFFMVWILFTYFYFMSVCVLCIRTCEHGLCADVHCNQVWTSNFEVQGDLLLQVLTEFFLVSVTSAVTVTIAGVVKEAITILVWIRCIFYHFLKKQFFPLMRIFSYI